MFQQVKYRYYFFFVVGRLVLGDRAVALPWWRCVNHPSPPHTHYFSGMKASLYLQRVLILKTQFLLQKQNVLVSS